jgi:hypothetical protein
MHDPMIMIEDSDGKGLFSLILSNDVLIQVLRYLCVEMCESAIGEMMSESHSYQPTSLGLLTQTPSPAINPSLRKILPVEIKRRPWEGMAMPPVPL